MKLKIHVIIILLAVVSQSFLIAQTESTKGKGFGAGVMIGQPTGLTFKYNNFPVVGVAWSTIDKDFSIFCDYWIVNRNLKGPVDFYIGLGGKLWLDNKNDSYSQNGKYSHRHGNVLGVRIPLGIQFFPIEKIELFAEIVPGILLYPETSPDIGAALGARYYF